MQDHNLYERSWYLAAKMLTSGLNIEEQKEWEVILEKDPEFHREFQKVKAYWEKLDSLPYQQIDTEKDWKAVWEKIKQQADSQERPDGNRILSQRDEVKRQKPSQAPWLKYAAAVSIFLICGFLLWWMYRSTAGLPGETRLTTIEAPAGFRSFVTLPDSSKLWLNAGSKISFDNRFGSDNRHIDLKGEAFFDVIKNKLPFTVHTEQYDIDVLGTAFNVKAYPDDDRVVTTLVRGSLKVKNIDLPQGRTEALLKPDEKLILWKDNETAAGSVLKIERDIDAAMETAWKDGWLSVRGESLYDLAKKLERLYDVDIHFEEENLKQYRYTGKIKQLSLEQVLKALSLTSPVEFSIDERTVTLRENETAKSKYQSVQEE